MEVKEPPFISTIRKGCTLMDTVCYTLAAYKLAKADNWKQLHTNASVTANSFSYRSMLQR